LGGLSSRVDRLSNRIANTRALLFDTRSDLDNVRNQEQAGVALAIATGQLRYDERPGKLSIGGGLGGFQHEGGGALGLGYTAPNERIRMNVSAGGSTHGDFGGGGGITFTLN
jgi:autotransporter adhesin